MMMIPIFLSLAQNCPLTSRHIYWAVSVISLLEFLNRHLKLKVFRPELIFSPNLLHSVFVMSTHGSSIVLIAQAKIFAVILNSPFISYCVSNVSSYLFGCTFRCTNNQTVPTLLHLYPCTDNITFLLIPKWHFNLLSLAFVLLTPQYSPMAILNKASKKMTLKPKAGHLTSLSQIVQLLACDSD